MSNTRTCLNGYRRAVAGMTYARECIKKYPDDPYFRKAFYDWTVRVKWWKRKLLSTL